MKVTWSLPVRGERLDSSRGDLVRARSLINALRADGHEVLVVEAAAPRAAAVATFSYRRVLKRVLPPRAALVLRDLGRVVHARAHARRVVAAARAQQAELIVETQVHFADSGARAARQTGVPLLLDDCSPATEEIELGAGLPGLARRLLRSQAAVALRLVVSSPHLARRLGDELGCREPAVVPNGVDPPGSNVDRGEIRRRIGAEPQDCVAVFVGSFQPWHAAELLLLALAHVPAESRLRLLLVGSGPGLAPALARARELGVSGRCTVVGAVPAGEVPRLLAGCDIGVLPGSNSYGQPMKLLEYAAAGLPAVAPDLPPVRDLVEPGHNGLLFRPGDVAGLANCLARLARDPALRRGMGEDARARVATELGWRSRARQLLELCARVPVAGVGQA